MRHRVPDAPTGRLAFLRPPVSGLGYSRHTYNTDAHTRGAQTCTRGDKTVTPRRRESGENESRERRAKNNPALPSLLSAKVVAGKSCQVFALQLNFLRCFGLTQVATGSCALRARPPFAANERITRPGVDVAERSEPTRPIPARVHPFVLLPFVSVTVGRYNKVNQKER